MRWVVELVVGWETILPVAYPADMGPVRSPRGQLKQLSMYKPHVDPAFQCRLLRAPPNREKIMASGGLAVSRE